MSKYDFEPKNYYRELGLKQNATKDEIKEAYFKLAKENHPDVNKSNSNYSPDKFQKISYAYEILSDDTRKLMIDNWLSDSYTDMAFQGRRERNPFASAFGSNRMQRKPPKSQRNKMGGGFHFENIMDELIRPRYIFGAFALFFGSVILRDTIQDAIAPKPKQEVELNNNLVAAWYNKKAKRYETPAPWNPDFRKLKNNLQKVNRKDVHVSKPP